MQQIVRLSYFSVARGIKNCVEKYATVIFNWKTSIENCRKKGLKLQTGKTIATDFFFQFSNGH